MARAELVTLVVAGLALLATLCGWVVLKGFGARSENGFYAGWVARAMLLGPLAAAVMSRLARRVWAAWLAGFLGMAVAWALRDVGVAWASNVSGWLQDGSTLTLLGGPRGLASRLTLVLVFAGAGLATRAGRHVSLEGVTRLAGEPLAPFLRLAAGLGAAAVCTAAGWGFNDFVRIDALDGDPATGLAKVAFASRQQLGIDVTVAGRVVRGTRWDTALAQDEWNTRLAGADFSILTNDRAALYEKGATRSPLLSAPGLSMRGLLVKPLGLVVAFGWWWLALRFLVWVFSGAPTEELTDG